MNILMLHNKDLNEQGGIANYIHGLSRHLVINGNRVDFVCVTNDKTLKKYEIVDGLHVHRLYIPARGFIGYFLRCVYLNKLIVKLHNRINFNVISLHTSIMYSVLKQNTIIRKIPLIYTLHMSTYTEMWYEFKKTIQILPYYKKLKTALKFPFYYFIYTKNEKGVLKAARVIIVTTEYVKSILERVHGTKYLKKVSIIPPGIDADKYQQLFDEVDNKQIHEIRNELRLPRSAVAFFILRRLSPRMGLENLIKAVSIVRNRLGNIDNLIFFIGGKGILRKRLETLIEELDLSENIRLIGFLSEKDKAKYLQISNCAIVPTEDLEGFGIFTIEALACGLPVIGTSIGGTIEIIKNVNDGKLLADGTSPAAIADKIIFFLENRTQFSNAGAYNDFVKDRYDWPKIAANVENAYRKAIV